MNAARRTAIGAAAMLLLAADGWSDRAVDHEQPVLFTQPFNPANIRLRIEPPSDHGLFRAGEPVTLKTADNAPVRVFTMRGETLYEGAPRRLAPLPPNHYFVETQGDRAEFAVFPADYRGAPFLGTEADHGRLAWHTEKLERIQPHWSRALVEGNTWLEIQPRRRQWSWTQMDRTVELCRAHKRKLIVTAWMRPAWMTQDARFIASYCDYLRRMCARYGDKLYAIEVWNEPNSRREWPNSPSLWIQSAESGAQVPAAYVKLLKASRATIKSVEPSIKVYGAGWAIPVTREFIEEFSRLGGSEYLDGFTFHDYDLRVAPPDVDTVIGGNPRPRLDKLMKQYRQLIGQKQMVLNEAGLYGRSALGIANTQSNGVTFLSGLSWQRGMARAVKFTVMYRAEDVAAIVPHILTGWTRDPKDNYELFGWEFGGRGPHPKTTAFLMTCHWLDGARLTGKRIIEDRIFLYEWERPNGHRIVFAWCVEGQAIPMPSARQARVTDIFGSDWKGVMLGEEPVLFHNTTLDAVMAVLFG